MKMNSENETSVTKGMCSQSWVEAKVWRLRTASDAAMPNDETASRSLRPARSTRKVQTIAPITWMIPTIIEETSGERVEPEAWKIVDVKFNMAKKPHNWFTVTSTTPNMIALRACTSAKSRSENFLEGPKFSEASNRSSSPMMSRLSP